MPLLLNVVSIFHRLKWPKTMLTSKVINIQHYISFYTVNIYCKALKKYLVKYKIMATQWGIHIHGKMILADDEFHGSFSFVC